ncbi:MAG: glycosyltransferase [Armatimonadota bacterium]|nr:glycosyltransferase [Armatimonadota bacterium]
MRLVVAAQQKLLERDGDYVAATKGYERLFGRYFEVFEEVVVLAQTIDEADWEGIRATGPGVSIVPLPRIGRSLQLVVGLPTIERRLAEMRLPDDAYLLRFPGVVADVLGRRLIREGRPFGIEVAGDPHLTFGPEGHRHPLAPVVRWHFMRVLRRQCASAAAVAYTSRSQRVRYPPAEDAFVTYYSYLSLPEEHLVQKPRSFPESGHLRLICVAALQRMFKSPDVAIDALAKCVASGLDLELVWVGGGRLLEPMRRRAQRRGVAGRVTFTGQLPSGRPVLEQLDAADLFLLPSRAEGLPSALLEAMARALPCIASDVGGIPDLLAEDDLVPPGRSDALARRIMEVAGDRSRMERMSKRNLQTAWNYRDEVVDQRRRAFYQAVKQTTHQWLDRHGASL